MAIRRSVFKSLLAAGAALALGAPAMAQQPVVLKFHTFMAPQSAVFLDMHVAWMDKVEKESNGRIKFERYPAMQLGGTPRDLYDQAKDGVVDIVWTLPGNTPGRFPRTEVFELPFMMSNAEATSRAFWEYINTMAKDEYKDVHLIALNVHGPGVIHTKDKQVKTVDDIKGLKLRGPTRFVTKLLGSLGATPVGMPLPQIPDSLSKGVIDGAVIPWEVVPSVRVNELTRFHAEFDPKGGALYTTTFVTAMNKAKYDSLPADLKKVIDANSGIETSAWLGKVQQSNDPKGRKTAETPRNTIFTVTPEAAAGFKKTAVALDEEWVREMNAKGFKGQELLDGARALIKKHTK
ncbi:MAG: C4-dicarboxylate ABC transporter [Lautropia sp. SCN 66-9]|nr:MAG: C4-dicarboxylate ABC transporter [Lautropia sp. SCN 66-9]